MPWIFFPFIFFSHSSFCFRNMGISHVPDLGYSTLVGGFFPIWRGSFWRFLSDGYVLAHFNIVCRSARQPSVVDVAQPKSPMNRFPPALLRCLIRFLVPPPSYVVSLLKKLTSPLNPSPPFVVPIAFSPSEGYFCSCRLAEFLWDSVRFPAFLLLFPLLAWHSASDRAITPSGRPTQYR